MAVGKGSISVSGPPEVDPIVVKLKRQGFSAKTA